METDGRRNPALLKLDVYCKGSRLADFCLVRDDRGRASLRTRAWLGSGIELILPGGLWTNVPVSERFARLSPYVLHRVEGGYVIRRHARPHAGDGGGALQVVTPATETVAWVRL